MPISAPLLLVEDDTSVRNTLSTFLDLEGYQVDAVSSTRAAMEKLLNAPYPIVISDIHRLEPALIAAWSITGC